MALIVPVLVRGINNLSDARYCAGMGADGLVFTLDPALPGAVDVTTVQELAGWVAGVELIGEFSSAMPYQTIRELVTTYGLNRVLLRYDESSASSFFAPAALQVSTLVEVSPHYLFDKYAHDRLTESLAEHFPAGFGLLTDSQPYLSAKKAQQGAAAALGHELWLGGPFTSETLRQVLSVGPTGLILQGGEEIKPGLRDFTELEAVFEQLEED